MLCSSSGEPWNLRFLFAIFHSTHIFFFLVWAPEKDSYLFSFQKDVLNHSLTSLLLVDSICSCSARMRATLAAMAVMFPKCPGKHCSHLEDAGTRVNAQPQYYYCCTFTQTILSRKITKAFHKYWTHTTTEMLPALLSRVLNKYYMAASKPTREGSVLATTAALTIYLAKKK